MREGIKPLIIGTVVTAAGATLRGIDMKKHGMTKRDAKVSLGAGLVGLGLAHMILGGIDLVED